MRAQRGFTLIELLIVIFIIGLLAAIVLASLSGAKSRGNDTGVRAEVSTIATQAVLYYGLANTYGVTNYGAGSGAYCGSRPDNGNTVYYDANTTVDTPIVNAIVTLQKDANGGSANVICRSDDQRFLITAKLSNNHWYCADSTASTTILGPTELTNKPGGIVCQ